MIRRFLIAFLAIGLAFVPASISGANQQTDLSPSASAAFADVGRCLTSGKSSSLSVFYLIDASGSLRWTDPENERKEILEGSVSELSSFISQGVDVEIAVSFFNDSVVNVLEWTTLGSPASAAAAAEVVGTYVNNENASGTTDWEEGLELAYKELISRQDSCKMLIWFTDGGINPSNDQDATDRSLGNLCRPGVGSSGLGSGKDFGLMADFRKAQIPVFGVLYSNLDAAYAYFSQNYPGEADALIAEELWLMSFMRPLLEGSGQIQKADLIDKSLPGGQLECAQVGSDGVAPPEQTNGAFLNASDPVALAFQFLRLGTQISGGAGSLIQGGEFSVPAGTAKFVVLVAGDQWELAGPEESGISGSSSEEHPSIESRTSAGASSLEVTTAGNETAVGAWKLETQGAAAELFLYPGMTFELDRDRSSKILSDYPNTITGKIVRTSEFSGYELDLQDFVKAEVSVAYADSGKWVEFDGVDISTSASGEFSIANLVPPSSSEELGVRLRLDLGPDFLPVESEFSLVVQDKNALATVSVDDIKLSNLIGPSGVASGVVTLLGPNSADSSQFCFSEQLRLDDAQTGIEKVDRTAQFTWAFTDLSSGATGPCFTLGRDEQIDVEVAASNPTQADSEVVAVWSITSKTEGVDAQFEAPVRFSFASEVETNSAVTWTVLAILMILGVALPLVAMWILNFVTTRFLSIENTVRAVFPVKISRDGSGAILTDARIEKDGDWKVGTRDFLYVTDQKSPRTFQTGNGEAAAMIPAFPLSATWYEWRAPEGSRIVSHYPSGTKQTKAMKALTAVEISPNMAENWALVVKDSDLMKPGNEAIDGSLVVFAAAAGLPAYESKLGKIRNAPRLKDDLKQATEKASEVVTEKETKKPGKKAEPAAEEVQSPTASVSAPPIPGFVSNGSSAPTTPPVSGPPMGSPPNGGTQQSPKDPSGGGSQKLPWEK